MGFFEVSTLVLYWCLKGIFWGLESLELIYLFKDLCFKSELTLLKLLLWVKLKCNLEFLIFLVIIYFYFGEYKEGYLFRLLPFWSLFGFTIFIWYFRIGLFFFWFSIYSVTSFMIESEEFSWLSWSIKSLIYLIYLLFCTFLPTSNFFLWLNL